MDTGNAHGQSGGAVRSFAAGAAGAAPHGMAAAGCAGGAVGHRGNLVPLQAAQLGSALDKRHHL